MTVKRSLLNRWQVSGQCPSALEGHLGPAPYMPWLWDWFLQLPMGISYDSLNHWAQLTGTSMEGWEAEILMSLDRLRIKHGQGL